jgi:hypothetical protein
MSDEQLRHKVLTLLFAGHNTTAGTADFDEDCQHQIVRLVGMATSKGRRRPGRPLKEWVCFASEHDYKYALNRPFITFCG